MFVRVSLVVKAVNHLKVRSCLIDGEVVCCDEKGVAAFQLLRHRRNDPQAFLYAFDLLELDGTDLRKSRSRCAKRRWPASCARAVRAKRHANVQFDTLGFRVARTIRP
jgi:hypothetical protein